MKTQLRNRGREVDRIALEFVDCEMLYVEMISKLVLVESGARARQIKERSVLASGATAVLLLCLCWVLLGAAGCCWSCWDCS